MVARGRGWGEEEMGEGGEKNNHFTKTKTKNTTHCKGFEN